MRSENLATRFFSEWYRPFPGTPAELTAGDLPDGAYCFVFKANLATTNLQVTELAALIRRHTSPRVDGLDPRRPQFLTPKEFTSLVDDGMKHYLPKGLTATAEKARNAAFESFARAFADTLSGIVVLDPLFASCRALLPPSLQLDLRSVVASAGYITSAGRLLFSRNTKKTEIDYVRFALQRATLRSRELGSKDLADPRPTLFCVLTEEDAASHEAFGNLDDVRMKFDRHYIGTRPLVEALSELRSDLTHNFKILTPGSYAKDINELRNQVRPDRRAWLFTDRHYQIGAGDATPTLIDAKYYVCYEEIYRKRDWVGTFDEDKPAWVDAVTMPHSLTGAVFNVCTDCLHAQAINGTMCVIDPFVGSGTSLFEAAKLSNSVLGGNDLSPAFPQLIVDNAEFFCDEQTRDNVRIWLDNLRRDVERAQSSSDGVVADRMRELVRASEDLEKLAHENKEQRFRLYVARRVLRQSQRLPSATAESETYILSQLSHVCNDLLHRVADFAASAQHDGRSCSRSHQLVLTAEWRGLYCSYVGVDPNAARVVLEHFRAGPCTAMSAIEWLKQRISKGELCHVLLTDPPYGINQREDLGESSGVDDQLCNLHSELIPLLLSSVRPGGVLAIVLPRESFNGQCVPPFMKPEVARLRLQLAADAIGRRLTVAPLCALAERLTGRRLYWRSTHVLEREVLVYNVE